MICTFIGSRNATHNLRPKVINVVTNLIEKQGVNKFYVGNHGNFDRIVKSVLVELKSKYPDIEYSIVLAYLPTDKTSFIDENEYTVYPNGLEDVPKRFAIIERNK